jgi:DNA-binding NtrC family response regulator
MARVLLVGYVAELLQERQRILHAAGYEVTVSSSLAAVTAAIAQERFDVAVVGFSVPEKERNLIAQTIKQTNPATKIIMIYFSSVKNTELADALMQTTATAEELVRAVNHILGSQDRSRLA